MSKRRMGVQTPANDTKKFFHYYLFAGEVMYDKVKDSGVALPQSRKMNCITRMEINQVSRVQIALAQHVMHKQFTDQTKEDPTLFVKEIFIHGFSYMGYMTDEESNPPMPVSNEDALKALQ